MATNTKTTAPANNLPGLPASWADTEVLGGVSLMEKDELIGRLFRVNAVTNIVAAEGYPGVRVEVEFTDGRSAAFQDFSGKSGVRAEIEEILTHRGKGEEALVDERIPLRFICPDGLRVSKYDKEDQRGVMRPSRSYYLTRSGVVPAS